MPNPFDFPDPFDRLNLFPRSRVGAAYPALDDSDTETQIQRLTRGTLSGLGYVGSTLDKLSGARAIRGGLAGKPRELLSLIPGSDVVGLTNESDTVHGEDLLRNLGYDPSQGNWFERNLVGPGVEIALDPSTYAGGIGALTRAGKIAAKTGAVAPGFLRAVQAGHRSVHPLVAIAEHVAPGAQQAAAAGLQRTGAAAQGANTLLRRVPGMAPVQDRIAEAAQWAETGRKSLFDKPSGWVPRREIQDEFRRTKHPADLAAEREIRGHEVDLHGQRQSLADQFGMDPQGIDRWLNRYRIGVPTTGAMVGPQLPGAEAGLESLGTRLVGLGRDLPEQIERQAGVPFNTLNDQAIQYGLRQKLPAPRGGRIAEAFANAVGGQKRLLPTAHGSMQRRLNALRNWEGGEPAIEELMRPEFAGRTPTLPRQDIVAQLTQDQLDRFHENRGMAWRNLPAGPVSPGDLAGMRGRAREMQRWLQTVPDRNIEGAVPGAGRLPFFSPDPIATTLERLRRARGVEGSANTIYNVVGAHARPAGVPGDVGLPEFLASTHLTSEQGMTRALESLGYDVSAELGNAQAALPAGTPFDPRQVLRELAEGHALPTPTARGAGRLLNRWQVPEEIAPWIHLSDELQNAFKTGVYSIWPGSLMRNIASAGVENTMMAGMAPDPRRYREITQALEGHGITTGIPGHELLDPLAQRNDLVRRAYIHGVLEPGEGEIAERVGLQAPVTGSRNPLAPHETVAQIAGQLPRSLAAKATRRNLGLGGLADVGAIGRQLGGKAENTVRLAEFRHLLSQGWSDQAAANMVEATHFKYGNLAPFENAVMKRLVPFYTFPRKNLPKQVARAVQSPTLTGGPIRFSGMLQNEDEGYVPDYLRSGLALPLGQIGPGTERYLSSLGLPMEEAFGRLKIGQSLPETVAKTAEAYLGSLRPGIRMPLEVATGRQFFTGRDLADVRPGNFENFVTGGNETGARVLSELAGATPISRALSTVNRLMDTRKYQGGVAAWLAAEAVPLASGARISDVDVEKWKAVDARNQLERELQQAPHIRQSRDFYADRDARSAGQVTPEEAEMLRTYAALKARAKEAAEAKKRVGIRIGG